MTTFFQANWTVMIPDLHLHPTPWHVSYWGTESAVHALVHPCCASVKSGSKPTELRQFRRGSNCVGVEGRSRAPWHRDELRGGEPKGNSSIDVDKTWKQTATAICFWQPQLWRSGAGFLQVLGIIILRGAFWLEYLPLFKPQPWNET